MEVFDEEQGEGCTHTDTHRHTNTHTDTHRYTRTTDIQNKIQQILDQLTTDQERIDRKDKHKVLTLSLQLCVRQRQMFYSQLHRRYLSDLKCSKDNNTDL